MLLPEDPLPIVLVGNKYDLLRDEDSVKRKAVAQCLRCVATRHAASVVMHARDEKELRRTFFLELLLFESMYDGIPCFCLLYLIYSDLCWKHIFFN